jgi:hypothetical protein
MTDSNPRNLMTDPKPLCVWWSSLAIATAGPDVSALRVKLLEDVREFLPDARGSFSHVIPSGEPGVCYLFTGQELPDVWEVTCQLAEFRPMPPLPDDHPVPRLRGKVTNFPVIIDGPDNTAFVAREE